MNEKILDTNFAPDTSKYAEALSLLIKCKTISEKREAFQEEFTKLCFQIGHLYPTLIENVERPFDDVMLFRVKGTEGGNPLVLMSHSDVVPENGKWSKDAWSGEIKDGVVWGRGAVDTKGSLVAILEAVDSLLAEGYRPKYDLIILSSFSEEVAGDDVPHAIERMKKESFPTPKLVMDEGGGIIDAPVPGVSGKFAMIGMAERGSAKFCIESRPEKGNSAAVNMADFIIKASAHTFGHRDFGKINTQMFDAMKPAMIAPMRFVFNNLRIFKRLLIKLLPKVNKTATQLLGPVLTFTPISAQGKNLPLDGYCTGARLSTNSDNNIDDVVKEFTAFAEGEGITVNLLTKRDAPADVSTDSAGYAFTASLIGDLFDGVISAPYNILGGTDARHFVGYAENVIRFAPIYMNNQQFSSFHKVDENLNVSSLADAVKFYREAVMRFNCDML